VLGRFDLARVENKIPIVGNVTFCVSSDPPSPGEAFCVYSPESTMKVVYGHSRGA